jgi:hypothetical protein
MLNVIKKISFGDLQMGSKPIISYLLKNLILANAFQCDRLPDFAEQYENATSTNGLLPHCNLSNQGRITLKRDLLPKPRTQQERS